MKEIDRLRNLIAKAVIKSRCREMCTVMVTHQPKHSLKNPTKIKLDLTAFLRVLEDRGTTPEAFMQKMMYHSSWLTAREREKPISMNMLGEISAELNCSPCELIPQDEEESLQRYKREFARVVLMYMLGMSWPEINKFRGTANSKGLCKDLWMFFCQGKSWDDFDKQHQQNKLQQKKTPSKADKSELEERFNHIYQLRLKRLSWQDISERMGFDARVFFIYHKKKFLKKAQEEFGQWHCELCGLPLPIDGNNSQRFCHNKLCMDYRKKYGDKLIPGKPVFW